MELTDDELMVSFMTIDKVKKMLYGYFEHMNFENIKMEEPEDIDFEKIKVFTKAILDERLGNIYESIKNEEARAYLANIFNNESYGLNDE